MIKLGRIKNFIPIARNKYLEPLGFPDCIHLNESCKCDVLVVDGCIGESCSFYKSNFEEGLSEINSMTRISSLDESKQKQISNIYYDGKMPWKKSK